MCPANCQSRGLLAMPVTVPKEVEPEAQLPFGPENTTLFQVFRQSASKTNSCPSPGSGNARRRPESRSQLGGLRTPYGAVRGALPMRYCGVATVETFCGVAKAVGSMYCTLPRF